MHNLKQNVATIQNKNPSTIETTTIDASLDVTNIPQPINYKKRHSSMVQRKHHTTHLMSGRHVAG